MSRVRLLIAVACLCGTIAVPTEGANRVVNGSFAQGLEGWSLWNERGNVAATVEPGSALRLSATGFNGGVYQTFSTGGPGTVLSVSGSWASGPTVPQAQWAEVLVINGPELPQDGVDLNQDSPEVVLIYKNDTWASPGGWSGVMAETAPVADVGSFVAAGDVATIVLKSGNLAGVHSGSVFDDVVVAGPDTPPPPPGNRAPTAALAAGPLTGTAPLTVSFDGSGSADPDGDTLSYTWSFGDGAQGSGKNVSHTYTAAGSFQAVLTVDDGRGGSDSASVDIVVDQEPGPTPSPSPPPSVEWDPRLDKLGVFVEEASVAPGSFYWKLVSARFESDGEIYPPPGGESESRGTHAIYVKTLDASGAPIENQRATASWPIGNPHSSADFLTKGAFDDYWGNFAMFGGNWCPFYPEGPRGPYGAYPADAPGDRVWGMGLPCNRHVSFRLVWQWTQKDGPGNTNQPPSASMAANPVDGTAPLVVSFDGSASSDPDGDPLSYAWTFGDGATGSGAMVSHTYAQAGSFTASLTVDDGRGGRSTESVRIEVASPANNPPSATAAASVITGEAPLTVSFDASGSWDPEGDALRYEWDFGDGHSAMGATVSHTYEEAGTYTALVTVRDGKGGADTAAVVIEISPAPGTSAKSKLTIHAGFGGPDSMRFITEAKPRIVKILDSFSAASEIKARSPKTTIIGRAFLPSQPMDGDPVGRAREWWSQQASLILQYPDVDYWEGYNEPIIQTPELMSWYAQFEAERVRLLAQQGLKAAIGNFSVGNPDLPLWPFFYAAIDAAIAHGGILGLHEYGTPMQQDFDFNAGEGWLVGRYRKVYRQFLIPDGKVLPLAITECGVDIVPPVGWKYHFTEAEYLDQLEWYDSILLEDDYVLGATIFALEIPGWDSFDIAPIVDELIAYVGSEPPSSPDPPAPGEPDMPDVIVEATSVVPASPSPGDPVTFTAVIRNVGGTPTPAGVPIGVAYFVDDTYRSYGITSAPLGAGASATLTTQGGSWVATQGSHTLTALADDVDRFAEADEQNNATSTSFSVGGGPALPDVVVDSVAPIPARPAPGQQVTFTSVVRNVGSASTPAGVPIGVAYLLNGAYTTWGAVTDSLAPGASTTITTQGGAWTATSGSFELTALADDVNRFAEADEQNNATSTSFSVSSGPPSAEASLYGMNIDPANPKGHPSPEELNDIGVRWVRIEAKASRGLPFYDGVIASYRNAGIKVMLLLDYATETGKPASNAGDGEWTVYLSRFVPTVSAIAQRYGNGVDAWQIWNEPDLFAPGTSYDPGVPAHHFGAMLRDATAAIRAHSSRPVVTAGLASGDPGYLAQARNAVGGLTVDAVAVHPYGQRAPDDWPSPQWGFGNMSDLFDRYLAFGLPLWVSEIGTVDQTHQAEYLENVYRLARDDYAGRVERVFWFCWSDGMVAPHGLLTSTGEPKASYWSYQAVAPPWP